MTSGLSDDRSVLKEITKRSLPYIQTAREGDYVVCKKLNFTIGDYYIMIRL